MFITYPAAVNVCLDGTCESGQGAGYLHGIMTQGIVSGREACNESNAPLIYEYNITNASIFSSHSLQPLNTKHISVAKCKTFPHIYFCQILPIPVQSTIGTTNLYPPP